MKLKKTGLKIGLLAGTVFLAAFLTTLFIRLGPELSRPKKVDPAFQFTSPLELASIPTAGRFDFPLGSEHGALAYNAQRFTDNQHLGDDLNGIGGENSDLGEPIYAIADGRVLLAREGGAGWGNIITLLHAYLEYGQRKDVQSYYAHVEKMLVYPGEDVQRGQQIAAVGDSQRTLLCALRCTNSQLHSIGPGYREDTRGWLDPSAFIQQHPGAPDDDVGRRPVMGDWWRAAVVVSTTPLGEIAPMAEQINPIEHQRRHYKHPHRILFVSSQLHNA